MRREQWLKSLASKKFPIQSKLEIESTKLQFIPSSFSNKCESNGDFPFQRQNIKLSRNLLILRQKNQRLLDCIEQFRHKRERRDIGDGSRRVPYF